MCIVKMLPKNTANEMYVIENPWKSNEKRKRLLHHRGFRNNNIMHQASIKSFFGQIKKKSDAKVVRSGENKPATNSNPSKDKFVDFALDKARIGISIPEPKSSAGLKHEDMSIRGSFSGNKSAIPHPSSSSEPQKPVSEEAISTAQVTVDTIDDSSIPKDAREDACEASAMDDDSAADEEDEEDEGLSSYERLREENMRRNADFLASLGLDSVKSSVSAVPKAKVSGAKRARSPPAPREPTRRSSRVANIPVDVKASVHMDRSVVDNDSDSSSESEEEQDLDDSDVLRYIMSDVAADRTADVESAALAETDPRGLRMRSASSEPLQCDDLPAVYSMDAHTQYPLLLAGGKGGNVCLFRHHHSVSVAVGEKGSEESSVLSSFHAHSRWVSSAKFLYDSTTSEQPPLKAITAADDATIRVWDLSRQYHSKKTNSKCPPCLLTAKDVHNRGIFDLEVCGGRYILTGSKDKTVAVSILEAGKSSLTTKSRFCLHSGVVKSVSWMVPPSGEEPSIYASGGQDRRVCVKDIRIGGDMAQMELPHCHDGGVHTVTFNPYPDKEHILMTAGMDPVIKVFDLRFVRERGGVVPGANISPLHEYRGHASSTVKKFKSIIPPIFFTENTILAAGQQSTRLSLYDLQSGKTISRGELGEEPVGCAVCRWGNKLQAFVASSRGSISTLEPYS